MSSNGRWKAWYRSQEPINRGTDLIGWGSKLSRILEKKNSIEWRAAVRGMYRDVGALPKSHAFLAGLEDDLLNYYRMDSARAVPMAMHDGRRGLIAHVPPFARRLQKDGTTKSAKDQFTDYVGATVPEFLEAVQARRLLVTVQGLDSYEDPFMRGVLEKLAQLDDDVRPVYANYAFDAMATTSGRRGQGALERLQKLIKKHPAGFRKRRTIWIRGVRSSLEPEVTGEFLERRLRMLSTTLPSGLWSHVQWVLGSIDPKKEADIRRIMDLVFVLVFVFHAPVHYSKGPSVRVCQNDVAHWGDVLGREALLARAQGERLGRYADRVDEVASGIKEGIKVGRHLALPVLKPIVSAGRRWMLGWPFRRGDVRRLEKEFDREGDSHAVHRIGAARQELQSIFLHSAGGLSIARAEALVHDAQRSVDDLCAANSERRIGQHRLIHATVRAGGTIPMEAIPGLSEVADIAEFISKGVERLDEWRLGKLPKEWHYGRMIGLDFWQANPT